jgi:Domain of unknown function (DUF3644)
MARPKRHQPMLNAARAEACLAVRLYNDPGEERSFEGFVVHMHLAYLYLLHAELTRDGVDYRYRRRDRPRLLERVDGEPKSWELAKCVAERWARDHPVRRNVEFFIALRNKIEHRYASRTDLALTAALGGHAQALLLNLEQEIVAHFGVTESLATRLRFPVFIGSFTDAGEETLRRLRRSLPAPLRRFIAQYEAGLPEGVADDQRYELRLRVVNELAPRDPEALAIQYSRYDDLSDEEKQTVEQLGRKGMVVVREQQRGVVNHELLKPREAVRKINEQVPFTFNMHHFVTAWKKLKIRPPAGDAHPERTDERYCLYDSMHRDYGYTKAFVSKVVRELKSEEGRHNLIGTDPLSR